MAGKSILDLIESPAPCDAEWADMIGNDERRFCFGCQKDVYNLSAMSRREAAKFVLKNNGKACVRFSRFRDGRVITVDRQFHQISRRSSPIAAAVVAAAVSLSAVAFSQTELSTKKRTSTEVLHASAKTSQISFLVLDPRAEPIPDTQIVLTNQSTKIESIAVTNAEGVVTFRSLKRGLYNIKASAEGFRPYKWQFQIQESTEPSVKINLELGHAVGIFVIADTDVPMFNAIQEQKNDFVKRAILEGFSLRTTDLWGNTALHIALKSGNLEMVKFLLERGAQVNARAKNGRTPILMLLESDRYEPEFAMEALRLMIAKGANLNVYDEDRMTLLMEASEEGYVDVVRLLLDSGANPKLKDRNGETAYEKTSSEGIMDLLRKHRGRKK